MRDINVCLCINLVVKYKPTEPKTNINKKRAIPIFLDGKTENMYAMSLLFSAVNVSRSAFKAKPTPKGIAPMICQNVKIINGPTRKYLHQLFFIFFAFSIYIIEKIN